FSFFSSLSSLIILYILSASSFFAWAPSIRTSKVTILLPNLILTISPTLSIVPALAVLPLIVMRPSSLTSFASVRLFIMRDTFKYLSSLIIITLFFYLCRYGILIMNCVLHPLQNFIRILFFIFYLFFFTFIFSGLLPHTVQIFHIFNHRIGEHMRMT